MQRTLIAGVFAGVAHGAALTGKHQHHEFLSLVGVKAVAKEEVTGPSAADYTGKCDAIDRDCRSRQNKLTGDYERRLAELKAECEKQTRILEGREEDHSDETADAKKSKMDVKEAKNVVMEYDQCRPELEAAKADLSKEESIPNESNDDIDRECQAKKLVMEKEACVVRLKAAEAVMSKEVRNHADEVKERDDAGAKVPPQAEIKRKVCAAYEALKAQGPPELGPCGERRRAALLRQADDDIADALAEYTKQKGKFERRQDKHEDEQADVEMEQADVDAAQSEVNDKAHCPPELAEAEASLRRQQAIPNDTPANIDAECKAEKAVMKARPCAEAFKVAEARLATEKDQLSDESQEENAAGVKVPPSKAKMDDAKAALAAARAARTALPCGNPDGAGKSDDDKEKPKSGAVRAAGVVVVAFLCTLVHA